MNRAKNIFLLFFISLSLQGFGKTMPPDSNEYYNPDFIHYEDFVYRPNIHSVIFQQAGVDMSSPILELGSNTRLQLSFDDFDRELKDYRYTLVHCDAAWQPSDLLFSQYLNGFDEDNIREYAFSVNTIQPYTHYNLVFPGDYMQPTLSGNYLLKVFIGTDRDRPVITRIFRIVEHQVQIEAKIHRPADVSERETKQTVEFSIFHSGYKIDDVFTGLKVTLSQNDRLDNAITNLKPMFIKENELDYFYEKGNVFNGGNEFRYFDTRTLKYKTERTMNLDYDSLNRIVLFPDEDRSQKSYSILPDINGKFYLTLRDNLISDHEGDYAMVYFTLPYPNPLSQGDIYVFGQFTDWRFKKEAKMAYNFTDHVYRAAIYLKQGYYNYEYVMVRDENKKGDETFIEGNHFETDNDYTIYVYNRKAGSRYDELIGYRKFNSKDFY